LEEGGIVRTGIIEYWNDGILENIVTGCGLRVLQDIG
jgi:hypothetical protein